MKYRNPVTTLLLALLFSPYTLYWWYDTGKRMQAHGIKKVPSLLPVFVLTVIYVALLIGTFLHEAAGRSVDTNPPASFWIAGLLVPIILVLNIIYCYRFSRAASKLVKTGVKSGTMTLIFLLVPAVSIYLIQDKINQQLPHDATE